ncbi:ATPase inhibitor subunit zeta [Telmatospirillum sp.]|uniref:ATPase inhibitor subunit zeta n=1 Tax=Telmatospirillum sp. TaxID=2079197 RepID=UPI002849E721|nr:ATPase inhibitor subunit zeta [Telmatospirillum sp.]MDR3437798.1 ATPase inhibitor subunit zeta [Telmatospirillum sp.]
MTRSLEKAANVETGSFAWNAEWAFRIRNRRNRLLGLWAASHLGLNDAAAAAYARKLVAVGVDVARDTVIAEIVHTELQTAGLAVPLTDVIDALNSLSCQAYHELVGAVASPISTGSGSLVLS